MKPVNVYFTPKSIRIAIGEEEAEKLVNYIFQALDNIRVNQVLQLKLSDVDIITYPCLMHVIRRLTYEMSKGGKYYNKFMVIQDLPLDSCYRKEMLETINAVIDKVEIPLMLMGNATSNSENEYEVLGSIFNNNHYLKKIYRLIREEEKKENSPLTAGELSRKLGENPRKLSFILRRLNSFRLLIREHLFTTGKSKGHYCYYTLVSRALEENMND